MECEWCLKLETILCILYHLVKGDVKRISPKNDVGLDVRFWLERLDEKGVRVYTCPLPVEVMGFSYPPLPVIIVSSDSLSAHVLLHEYGHIRAGFMSREEEAEFIKEKCLWRDELL